jgi:hypothetical protein
MGHAQSASDRPRVVNEVSDNDRQREGWSCIRPRAGTQTRLAWLALVPGGSNMKKRNDCRFSTLAIAALLLASLGTTACRAGEADVVDVKVRRASAGTYDFDVTIRSIDKGWEHYADAFEILSPEGTLLGRRVLAHPHETEQPFTRELHGVRIPPGVQRVVVRARHKPKGYDGKTLELALPR